MWRWFDVAFYANIYLITTYLAKTCGSKPYYVLKTLPGLVIPIFAGNVENMLKSKRCKIRNFDFLTIILPYNVSFVKQRQLPQLTLVVLKYELQLLRQIDEENVVCCCYNIYLLLEVNIRKLFKKPSDLTHIVRFNILV